MQTHKNTRYSAGVFGMMRRSGSKDPKQERKVFMSWASKRKFLYFLSVLIIVSAVVAIPTWLALDKAPTSVDNKQNGEEVGVDCGRTMRQTVFISNE